MTPIKERLIGAITVMDNSDAEKIWNFILSKFDEKSLWDSIEEVEPTEDEIAIFEEYKNKKEEYQPYITHEELMKELEL